MERNNNVEYLSTDKMYSVKTDKHFNTKIMSYLLMCVCVLLLVLSVFIFSRSVNLSKKTVKVDYTETGNADYTVYLKDNTYYDQKYLPSGMQYVANLINTINAKFNYEIHSDKNLDFEYNYKIVGTLQIVDSADENKVIYSKDYNLLDEKTDKINSNSLVIHEDVDVDYEKFNSSVNSYKSEYGLSANSRLVVTMSVNTKGSNNETEEKLQKSNKLQITIPLSEQTLSIPINSDAINNKDSLSAPNNHYITSAPLFASGIGLVAIMIIVLIVSIRFHKEYVRDNIYTITVNKILRDYDKLIVNGNVTVDERTFANKIHVQNFTEMVDASENLNSPILYYNVIPGEKCFFIIIKGDTLYKYRLTKAFLQREKKDSENNQQPNQDQTQNQNQDQTQQS